ncbi:MAG TPA: response regulator [Terriglobales bacterium]|nr:response regulator [Terriglobales bacterium]
MTKVVPPSGSKKILVADDDRALRSMLASMLERAGFSVTAAGDGAEALAHIKHRKFDLVLLDVWMPNMTGLEVLARLKDKPGKPKVIVMTGDNTPETLLNAVREQAYQYINKPFSAKGVVEMVERALASESGPPIEVLSARPEWIELLVPCERQAAERIQDFLLQAKSDLPQEVREAVGQAFRELLLNAIEWGGDLDPNQKVRISCLRTQRMILYRIADPGRGFRFEGLTHAAVSNPPDSPIEHLRVRDEKGLRPGGFGILLTRAVVDELLYNEAQNEVAFVKYLDGGPKS